LSCGRGGGLRYNARRRLCRPDGGRTGKLCRTCVRFCLTPYA
jgi:hypothetical protein